MRMSEVTQMSFLEANQESIFIRELFFASRVFAEENLQ
jgi:hypothetical protein